MAKDLTVKALENLKPGAARREVPDGHTRGLFFVLQPSGAASWAFRYRLDGKTAKLTLGPFPGLDLKSARELASEAIKTLARGADPRAAKRDAREAARIAARSERNLVESVVHDFLETHVARNLKASTQYEVGRLLAKELAPWRGRRIDGIDPQDVRRLLDAIVDRGAEITANRLFSALRRMFRWARERRIIERSPCDDIRAPTSERGRARERVLDDPELALRWSLRSDRAASPPNRRKIGFVCQIERVVRRAGKIALKRAAPTPKRNGVRPLAGLIHRRRAKSHDIRAIIVG